MGGPGGAGKRPQEEESPASDSSEGPAHVAAQGWQTCRLEWENATGIKLADLIPAMGQDQDASAFQAACACVNTLFIQVSRG